jgi:hypothetical protein
MMMHQNMKMMEITQQAQALLLSSTQQPLVSSLNTENVNYIASQINTNTNNINNTINTNTFNLNFFLNEQCKDAMNITEFVDSLQLNITDLDNTCDLGYVEAISRIFTRKLKELDIYKRPIHCSDVKREVMYIKDNGIWEKDNEEKSKMKNAIKHIAHKNLKQVPEWRQLNPEFMDPKSKKCEQYMTIMNKSCGGIDAEEDDKYWNKIIKNVAKVVVINK